MEMGWEGGRGQHLPVGKAEEVKRGSRGPNSLCGFGQALLREEQGPSVLTSEDFVPLTLSFVPTPQAKDCAGN